MRNMFTKIEIHVKCKDSEEKRKVLEKYFPEVKKQGLSTFGTSTSEAYADMFAQQGDPYMTLIFSSEGIHQVTSYDGDNTIDARSLLSVNTLKGVYNEC